MTPTGRAVGDAIIGFIVRMPGWCCVGTGVAVVFLLWLISQPGKGGP
jgi:hypothetical protein